METVLGGFISPDSIMPDYANPQSLNRYRYAYVYNNPLKYTDPSGHCGIVGGGAGNPAVMSHSCMEALGGAAFAYAVVAAANQFDLEVDLDLNLNRPSSSPPIQVSSTDIFVLEYPETEGQRPVLLAPEHIMQPHSAPMNADPPPLDSGLTIEDTYLTASDNRYFDTRGEAFNGIKDRAGIPRTQQPIDQWTVGNNVLRTRAQSYRFSRDRTTHGRYYLYDMGQQGMVVIAEHTSDPGAPYPHFHTGKAPEGADKDFNFRQEHYKQILPKHHYYYKE